MIFISRYIFLSATSGKKIWQFQQRIAVVILVCKLIGRAWMGLCTWSAPSLVDVLIRGTGSGKDGHQYGLAAGMGVYAAQHSLYGGQQAQQDQIKGWSKKQSYCDLFHFTVDGFPMFSMCCAGFSFMNVWVSTECVKDVFLRKKCGSKAKTKKCGMNIHHPPVAAAVLASRLVHQADW